MVRLKEVSSRMIRVGFYGPATLFFCKHEMKYADQTGSGASQLDGRGILVDESGLNWVRARWVRFVPDR